MKKALALLLGTMIALATFSACSAESSSAENSAESSSSDTQEVEKVVMGFMTFTGPMPEQQAVQDAINAITVDSIGVEVEMLIMDPASYSQQVTLMLSGGEQLDLFNAITVGFSSSINNGYLLDLEENDLIQTYGQGIIDELGDFLDGTRFGGKLYGVTSARDLGSGYNGYTFASEYLEGIGYTYNADDINYITEDDLENILADLHTTYPDKSVLGTQQLAFTNHIPADAIGGDYFGVLMDPANSLEVTNPFTSQEYLDLCTKYYNWNQMGYISGDALTDETPITSQVAAGTLMGYPCGNKPGLALQESVNCNKEMIHFVTDEQVYLFSNFGTSMPWVINSNTEVPEAAMKLLNAFYTDPELSNLLCYGIEGQHYAVNSDGLFTNPEGVTAETNGYHPNITWLMPNEFIAGVWEGNDSEIWTKTREFNDSAIQSLAIGFTFDNSSVSTQYSALTNTYAEYRNQLEYGFLEPTEGIAAMEARLENSGIETYIAEKQAQLDAWAQATGVSAD